MLGGRPRLDEEGTMPATTRRRVRQRAKGPIDPRFGQHLRLVREARGMSQAQVAGSDFSSGFISLVETGRTRVSLRAAQVLAARLNVTVTELMESAPDDSRGIEISLARAETELLAGRPEEALKRLSARASGTLAKVRVGRLRGRAHLASGRPAEAVKALDDALRLASQLGHDELRVRLLFDLAQAHEALDEPGEAVALALQAAAALHGAQLVDRTLELQVRASLALGFTRLGDGASAAKEAQRAAELAQDVSDPRALASLYVTLTATAEASGDLEGALAYAHRALEPMRQLGQSIAVVAALNNLAYVHARRREFVRADEVLDRAIAKVATDGLTGITAALDATRAEARIAQGRHAEALALATHAAEARDASAQTHGLALLLVAESLAALGRPGTAIRPAYARAISALHGRPARLRARAHRSFAAYLRRHGRAGDALDESERALDLLEGSG